MLRARRIDLLIALGLLALAILFYAPVTLGGRTLLPADITAYWEPWASAGIGDGAVPDNSLLGDLYVQNLPWKTLIVQSIHAGEIPLWNPYVLCGVPFLAAGQHSALYPLSLIYYVLPLTLAYGWFAVLHLWLAGLFTYMFCRTLRRPDGRPISRAAGVLAGIAFMFGGFLTSHVVFPMMVAAAVWLPLLLLAIERLAQRAMHEGGSADALAYLSDTALGALAVGMICLAGHPEMYYYTGLTAGAYGLWRLVAVWRLRGPRAAGLSAAWMAGAALIGIGLGSGQWLPLMEYVQVNWRQGGATFAQVQSWAWPWRRIVALAIPDFFGNPAHHQYLDLFTGRMTAVTVNSLGGAIQSTEWGLKNYVEGSGYLGTLPLILALIALLRRRRPAGFFGLWAALSLLFVFGTPLYYLVYRLPGFTQVHTPFRWIYPYSLCVAVLAAIGLDALIASVGGRVAAQADPSAPRGARLGVIAAGLMDWVARAIPAVSCIGGVALLGMLGLSLILKEHAASLGQWLMEHLARAPEAFADGRMFWSYEARNLLILALALVASGALLMLLRRVLGSGSSRSASIAKAALAAALVGELFAIGYGFYPRVDRSLVDAETPALQWLAAQEGPFRIATYGDDAILPPNTAMLYGLEDIRGYDSIIPRQYVEYMQALWPQGGLAYNRIAAIPADQPQVLGSPLLNMLNVRYVLSRVPIERDGYTLVYQGEILIYRNEAALPRAYTVPHAQVVTDEAERTAALAKLDPSTEVILEEEPADALPAEPAAGFPLEAESITHGANEVLVTVDLPSPGMLVLADSYADGWVAYLRPAELTGTEAEDAEEALTIYRANGAFRAVEVPAGHYTVRFKYSPDSVKYGLYLSFMSGVVLALGLGQWLWRRHYREDAVQSTAQRVTKNTIAPIGLNLINKGIDMAFAMLMLRILGPVAAGQYYLAIVVVGWFDIWINFGLNTLATREVSRDRSQANRYLSNTILLRGVLWLVALPLLGAFVGMRQATQPLDGTTIVAIGLFLVGLLPSNISASFTASFTAYEQMEVPASVTTLTTLAKVFLGTVALLAGTGYVGLGAVSIVVNLITLGVLYTLHRRRLFVPRLEHDWRFQREMLGVSWPLMVNLLLATLFFKVAVLLIEVLLPDPRVLGWYSTAYKYIDAVGVVPAFFTIAIFPLMSRYAAEAKGQLLKAYELAVKLLVMFAIPMGVAISALSTELIGLLGGSQYLPQAADVLAVMIWYMPFGFINSVTQYVLIALGQQRYLTRAFAIGLSFNVIANVILLTRVGYMASAWVAIFSELALLIPFYVGVRRNLARVAWVGLLWRPVASALPMVLMFWLLPGRWGLLALPLGGALYLVLLRTLGALNEQERAVALSALPLRRFKRRAEATPQ